MFFNDLTNTNFENEVLESPAPVVVVFYTDWSGCSQIINFIMDELNVDAFPSVKFCRINADINQEIVQEYGIQMIPTILFFYNKKIVDSIEGIFPKSNILNKLSIIQNKYDKNHKSLPDYDPVDS